MRNLLRAAAACALALTALSTVEAVTYGTCHIRCYPNGSGFVWVQASTTYGDCCGTDADVDQYCPPGYSGVAFYWNYSRCGV